MRKTGTKKQNAVPWEAGNESGRQGWAMKTCTTPTKRAKTCMVKWPSEMRRRERNGSTKRRPGGWGLPYQELATRKPQTHTPPHPHRRPDRDPPPLLEPGFFWPTKRRALKLKQCLLPYNKQTQFFTLRERAGHQKEILYYRWGYSLLLQTKTNKRKDIVKKTQRFQ